MFHVLEYIFQALEHIFQDLKYKQCRIEEKIGINQLCILMHIFVRSSLRSASPTKSSTALWIVSEV